MGSSEKAWATPTLGELCSSGLKPSGCPGAKVTEKAAKWEGSLAGA